MKRKVIIIAEAGVNHNGSLHNAKLLIDEALNAGVDYIKFQTFQANKIASKFAGKADYQKQTTSSAESQQDMLKKLELDEAAHIELIAYAQSKGINFLSTAFDLDSIDLLYKLGIKLGKIPSGEITNLPYLRKMAVAFPKIIMSTGMADMEDIENAIKALTGAGTKKEDITVLHCNTEYPTPMQDVNLLAMLEIKNRLGVEIGYSDHTLGIEVPVAAVSLGATIIEKHFTLDKTMEGPDHKSSLEPAELKAMVSAIRNIELALGNGVKAASASELKNKAVARKSIVAAKSIKTGEIFTEENLTVKRPGTGISPMLWDQVIGGKASRNYEEDELIVF
ncbi:N-acetylneuraminate synthase [Chitinophaga niastensis]|uniref:N-acetylneuraminate synthase n=1 Tax=Chitinophaga niastensis TaxID=536980 RepID=A0A2P8HRV5_CHINA|nr:N-acetylneuraminate synthase [Chitinophaga niastensis]PSL48953.1 N-acetylneuraminate synthase [Chitinophaga niastensis]